MRFIFQELKINGLYRLLNIIRVYENFWSISPLEAFHHDIINLSSSIVWVLACCKLKINSSSLLTTSESLILPHGNCCSSLSLSSWTYWPSPCRSVGTDLLDFYLLFRLVFVLRVASACWKEIPDCSGIKQISYSWAMLLYTECESEIYLWNIQEVRNGWPKNLLDLKKKNASKNIKF